VRDRTNNKLLEIHAIDESDDGKRNSNKTTLNIEVVCAIPRTIPSLIGEAYHSP
jgi:hypothetical protein